MGWDLFIRKRFVCEMTKIVQNIHFFQIESSDVIFTVEQCHAINNIEFVLQSIRPFVNELKVPDILRKIEDLNGGLVADACRKTIQVLIENAIENVENQIINVSEHNLVFEIRCRFISTRIFTHTNWL